MKTLWIFILLAIFSWSSPVSAEYCTFKSDKNVRSCIYKIDRIQHNSQIIISYTRQGWTMMIAVFLDEFAIIEGDAKVRPGKGKMLSIEHVTTRRDMTPGGRMMETPIYLVTEAQLREFGNAKGKIRFYLTASESKDEEVEVAASLFSDIDAYITETKSVLGVLFEDK